MVIYSVILRYESLYDRQEDKDTLISEEDNKTLREMISEINDSLGQECGLDGNISVFVVDGKDGALDIIMTCKQENVSDMEGFHWIKEHFYDSYSVNKVWFEERREISSTEFKHTLVRAEKKKYGIQSWAWRELGFDYFGNRQFHVQESLHKIDELSKAAVLRKAAEAMADKTLLEELERIFSDKNEKKYYGNPVHYLIKAGTPETAKDIIEVLMFALKINKRILGSRLTYVREIE